MARSRPGSGASTADGSRANLPGVPCAGKRGKCEAPEASPWSGRQGGESSRLEAAWLMRPPNRASFALAVHMMAIVHAPQSPGAFRHPPETARYS